MIIRKLEVCPHCGQYMPWRRYASKVIDGIRRQYVRCKRCGAKEVVVYREGVKVC